MNTDGQNQIAKFTPTTPQGMVICDYIAALRSVGASDEDIRQALLTGIEKGLP
jgi:hypothetical protein